MCVAYYMLGNDSEDGIVKQSRQNPCLQGGSVLVGSQCLIKEENHIHLKEDKLNVSKKQALDSGQTCQKF